MCLNIKGNEKSDTQKREKISEKERGMKKDLLSLPLVLMLRTTKALIIVALCLHKLHVVRLAIENTLK